MTLVHVLVDTNQELVQMSDSVLSLDEHSLVDSGFTDDEHKDMDDNTWFAIRKLKIDLKSPSLADLATVIAVVVNESPTPWLKLNELYRNKDEATALLRRNKTIEAMLRKIMSNGNGKGSFKELRQLRILQDQGQNLPKYELLGIGSRAFYETTYRGTAADLFLDYLFHNDELFEQRENRGGLHYYAKVLSIVQSSGTGKSRMVHELGKQGKCILVYMSLGSSDFTFPRGNIIPIELLRLSTTNVTLDPAENRLLQSLAIFRTFASEAAQLRFEYANKLEEFPREWYNRFFGPAANGVRFFRLMEKFFWESLESITKSLDVGYLRHLENKKDEDRRTIGHATMLNAYNKTCDELRTIGLKAPLLIVFDEAAWLANFPKGLEHYSIKQSHILCRVISTFSHHIESPVWCIFVSTNSRTGDFSELARTRGTYHSSDRIRLGGELLFRPFTELGLHQLAKPLKDIDLGQVWKYENLVGFGRPLWAAQIAEKRDSVYELTELRQSKLVKGRFKEKDDQWLAVMSQRFCLDLVSGHLLTVAFEEEAVAGYMRYLTTTSEKGDILNTAYPSEPVLSQSAAEHLWEYGSVDPFVTPILALSVKINEGVINKVTVGELVARLLLLIAKDICARELEVGKDEFRYCGSVRLVTWLKRLFGDDIFSGKEESVEEHFGNTVINFSHWVGMAENIADEETNSYPHPEWLQRLFVTTAAIKCCHGQPLIDNLIPTFDPVKMDFSSVLIQVKHSLTLNKEPLEKISSEAVGLNPEKPCVIILMDLDASNSPGSQDGIDVTLNERGEPPCLRIHAKGCDAETYKGLKDYTVSSYMKILLKLREEPAIEGGLKTMRDRARIFDRRANVHWE
ncbi:hypothetical protein DFH11DRAFT_1148974 [Phellopilus nigrolimitatus]|nr:hypothetical protein DFH11DRAFT_1148974 [Phellopilus nigrolimitatus]